MSEKTTPPDFISEAIRFPCGHYGGITQSGCYVCGTIHHQESVIAGLVAEIKRWILDSPVHCGGCNPANYSRCRECKMRETIKDPAALATSWEEEVRRKEREGIAQRIRYLLKHQNFERKDWRDDPEQPLTDYAQGFTAACELAEKLVYGP